MLKVSGISTCCGPLCDPLDSLFAFAKNGTESNCVSLPLDQVDFYSLFIDHFDQVWELLPVKQYARRFILTLSSVETNDLVAQINLGPL